MTSGRLLPGLTVRRLLTATPAARPQNKTTSAETADNAGTPQLRQFHMVSIKEFPRGISDQVISLRAHDGECERAPGPGLKLSWSMHALTNRSHRLQATSFKQQAPSNKLDMKDIMGYINLMIGLLIGQCAQAWNLQSSLPLKCRGVGRNSGLQAKPFFIYPKIQASSGKHQAPSSKAQA